MSDDILLNTNDGNIIPCYQIILMGFAYESTDQRPLSSVILDLYHVYRSITPDKYTMFWVLTDINEVSDFTLDVLSENKEHNGILNFIPWQYCDPNGYIGNNGLNEIHDPRCKWLTINTLDDYTKSMDIIQLYNKDVPCNKLLVYYTGHGSNEIESVTLPSDVSYIVFPDKTRCTMDRFRDDVISLTDNKDKADNEGEADNKDKADNEGEADIVFILDCCHCDGLGMPYILDPDIDNFRFTGNTNFYTQNILVLSSCKLDQNSMSDKYGSYFTTILLQNLKTSLNLIHIINNVRKESIKKFAKYTSHDQDMQIHSSYSITPLLWSWVFQYDRPVRCNIHINDTVSCFIIEDM